jgi:hypothetical protein
MRIKNILNNLEKPSEKQVKVVKKTIRLKPILKLLEQIRAKEYTVTQVDTQPIVEALKQLQNRIIELDSAKDISSKLDSVTEAVKSIDVKPEVKVEQKDYKLDTKEIVESIGKLIPRLEAIKATDPESMKVVMQDVVETLFNRSAKSYLNVRLSNGKDFISAFATAIANNNSGVATEVTLQNVLSTVTEGITGLIDTNNVTTTLLGSNEVFTGVGTDILNYSAIAIQVDVDVAGTLQIQFSEDNIDWHIGEQYSIPAVTLGEAKFFTPPAQGAYYRIKFINGATPQGRFHVHSVLKPNPIKWSSHNINSNLHDDDDAELNVSVLKLRTAQDNYVSGSATNSGNFKVSLEEFNGTVKTEGLPVTLKDNAQLDAFGRQRSSEPTTRFDVEFIYDKQPLLVDEVVVTGGTATHDTNSRDVVLAVNNTTTGTSAGLYSHYDIPYTAGNSQLIDITGTLDDTNLGNGIAYTFVRTKVSGSVVETVTPQSSWSNLTTGVNWQYSHILMIDFQSLKVGRIRYFLVQGGVPVQIDEVHNDNVRKTGYWQRPTLPLYWRTYNGATYTYMEMGYGDDENAVGLRYRVTKNATATLRAICGTVKSEGGKPILELDGLPFGISNRITPVVVSTTLIPILSIRMGANFNSLVNRGLALAKGLDIQTDNPINLRVLYRPTLTGASWTAVDANSFMEYDVSATAVTGGTLVQDIPVATSRNIATGIKNALGRTILSQGRTGTSDILSICAIRSSTTNANVSASINWEEVR